MYRFVNVTVFISAGFGGKVEPGETIISAAIREMREESSVIVQEEDLFYASQLTFVFPWRPSWSQVVHVYVAYKWSGFPSECFEMKPDWFVVDKVPYDRMRQDAAYWLPLNLAGENIRASFTFIDDNGTIIEISFTTEGW
jgi:8-oxo-dGTP diphosphatase